MRTGIYIHVPFCARKCPYCGFYTVPFEMGAARAYTDAVLRNIAALPQGLRCDAVYFGGGSPSLLPDAMTAKMLDALAARIDLAPDSEITLEANPKEITSRRLSGWLGAGVNRLSVGAQSLNDEKLRILGRAHTGRETRDALERAYHAGFENLSADLIAGLANDTPQNLREELCEMIKLPVSHLSLYGLQIEPGTPYFDAPPPVPGDDAWADSYLCADEFLESAGFSHYEISNFARKGFEARMNLKYWRGEPYYGIGPAAHSCFDGKRYACAENLDAFCAAETQNLIVTEESALNEEEILMLRLRLKEGVKLSDIPRTRQKVLEVFRGLPAGYARLSGERVSLTPKGFLVQNAILSQMI